MKSIISKTIALLTICATLFSFSPKPGGEGFEIYLNNKLLFQKFGSDMTNIQSLQLTPDANAGNIIIKYHHCGKVGKNRIVTIKDTQNKTLKEFRYADAGTPVAAMSLPVKEILNLQKAKSSSLKLFYSSTELPNGRILASISNASVAK